MHLGGLIMITMVLLLWPASKGTEASTSSYNPRALVNTGSLSQHPILNFQEEEERTMAYPGIIMHPARPQRRGRAECSYFTCTFPPAHIRGEKITIYGLLLVTTNGYFSLFTTGYYKCLQPITSTGYNLLLHYKSWFNCQQLFLYQGCQF